MFKITFKGQNDFDKTFTRILSLLVVCTQKHLIVQCLVNWISTLLLKVNISFSKLNKFWLHPVLSNGRVKSGNFKHQVNSDSDLV